MSRKDQVVETPDDRNKKALLDAAHRLILERGGISLRLDDLSLDMVSAEAGLSRATAYRTWASKDDFELDLLCDLAGPNAHGAGAFDQETINLATRLVASNLDKLGDPTGRGELQREVIRLAAGQNFEAAKLSVDWRAYVALSATALTMPDSPRKSLILDALGRAEETFLNRMSAFYEDMSTILGLRLRQGIGDYRHVAAAGAAVVEGLSLRHLVNPGLVDSPLTMPGPGGPEEWTLAAWGFFGVINQLTEPDPDYDPQAALAKYFMRMSGAE